MLYKNNPIYIQGVIKIGYMHIMHVLQKYAYIHTLYCLLKQIILEI